MTCISPTMVVIRDGLSRESLRKIKTQECPWIYYDNFFEVAAVMGTLNGTVLLVASAGAWSKVAHSFDRLIQTLNVQRICWLQDTADMARLLTLDEKGWSPDLIIQSGRQLISLWQQLSWQKDEARSIQEHGQQRITLEDCDVSASEIEALLAQEFNDSKMTGGV